MCSGELALLVTSLQHLGSLFITGQHSEEFPDVGRGKGHTLDHVPVLWFLVVLLATAITYGRDVWRALVIIFYLSPFWEHKPPGATDLGEASCWICMLVLICCFGQFSRGSVLLSVMLASPCQFQIFRR